MIAKPTGYDSLKDSELQCRIVCGGVTYTDDMIMGDGVRLTHALYDKLSVGGAQSARLQVTLLADAADFAGGIIPLTFSVRYSDGTTSTDWIPEGTYYVDSVEDLYDGTVKVTAYDALLLAEEDFFPGGEVTGTWPQAASSVVSVIASRLGVTYDITGFPSGIAQVPTPYSLTMREVLQDIAASAGGSWTMTKSGVLRFMQLRGLYGAAADETVPASRLSIKSSSLSVGGITLKASDGTEHSYSPLGTGYVVKGVCTYATDDIAQVAYRSSITYRGYSVAGAILSPLLELGDCIEVDSQLMRMDSYDVRFDGWIHGTVDAPVETEIQHRITYVHRETVRAAEAAVQQITQVPDVIQAVSSALVTDPVSLTTLSDAIGGGGGGSSSIQYISAAAGDGSGATHHFLRIQAKLGDGDTAYIQIGWTHALLHSYSTFYPSTSWWRIAGATDNGWWVSRSSFVWGLPFLTVCYSAISAEMPTVTTTGNDPGYASPIFFPWEIGSDTDKSYQQGIKQVLELTYDGSANNGQPIIPKFRLWQYYGIGATQPTSMQLKRPALIMSIGTYDPSST